MYLVIDDEDLKRMGLYDDIFDIYAIDKNLLHYIPDSNATSKKDKKLHFNKEAWHETSSPVGDAGPGVGSNCWAVHGKHTESGYPILSCDPHLMKWL